MRIDESPKFEYVPEALLENIVIDEENERQTHYELSFFGLRRSIARKGVITPIGLELMDDGSYKVVYGNRRVLASKSLGLENIKAKVYTNLSEEQRHEMQVAENATKVKIPLTETAENLWEYYKTLITGKTKGKYDLDYLAQFNSYWDLPSEVTHSFSLTQLAKRIGFSRRKTIDALRYVTLHGNIKEMVEKGSLTYKFAQELGRIKDKNEQRQFLRDVLSNRRDTRNTNPITNKDQLAKAVSVYLQRKEQELIDATFSLTPTKRIKESSQLTILEKEIRTASRIMGNFSTLLTIDPKMINGKCGYKGGEKSIEDILARTETSINIIEESLKEKPEYDKIFQQVMYKAESTLDKILSGEFDEKISAFKDPLARAQYKLVGVDQLVPDKTQPRKSFPKQELERLAASIKKVGLLSPIIVREIDGKYHVVVGHRRSKAAALAGLNKVDVLICKLTDQQCREIQYEEDIFEKVILSERADKLYGLYQLKKEKLGKEYSLKDFANEHNELSVRSVIRAVEFASLPQKVKLMYEKGLLSYGSAIAIAHTASDYFTKKKIVEEEKEDWIINWAIQASLSGYKAKEVKRRMNLSLAPSLMDLHPEEFGGKEIIIRGRRKIVADQVLEASLLMQRLEDRTKELSRKELITEIIQFKKKYEGVKEQLAA